MVADAEFVGLNKREPAKIILQPIRVAGTVDDGPFLVPVATVLITGSIPPQDDFRLMPATTGATLPEYMDEHRMRMRLPDFFSSFL